MLYNNPIAYGTDVLPEQMVDLAVSLPNFVAVKESSADVRRVTSLRALLGDRLAIMVGVDDLVLEGSPGRGGRAGSPASPTRCPPSRSASSTSRRPAGSRRRGPSTTGSCPSCGSTPSRSSCSSSSSSSRRRGSARRRCARRGCPSPPPSARRCWSSSATSSPGVPRWGEARAALGRGGEAGLDSRGEHAPAEPVEEPVAPRPAAAHDALAARSLHRQPLRAALLQRARAARPRPRLHGGAFHRHRDHAGAARGRRGPAEGRAGLRGEAAAARGEGRLHRRRLRRGGAGLDRPPHRRQEARAPPRAGGVRDPGRARRRCPPQPPYHLEPHRPDRGRGPAGRLRRDHPHPRRLLRPLPDRAREPRRGHPRPSSPSACCCRSSSPPPSRGRCRP